MNNPFHTRLIDLKVELSRIPHHTITALGEALTGNRTIADAIELVRASTQDLGKLRGEVDEVGQKTENVELRVTKAEAWLTPLEVLPDRVTKAEARLTPLEVLPDRVTKAEARLTPLEVLPDRVSKLEVEHAQLAGRFKCLVGLVLLDDVLAHWSDENSDSQKDRIHKAWHAVDEPMRGIIAELPAGDEPDCQKAWQDLSQDLPGLSHQKKDRVGHLRAAIRKLRWALLRRS